MYLHLFFFIVWTLTLTLRSSFNIAKKVNDSNEIIDPCKTSPCGEHAICTINPYNNKKVDCQCIDNFIGKPPYCKPECMRNSDCKLDKACVTNKCSDPCLNNCGLNSECKVVNHRPVCACLQTYTGDPFVSCNALPLPGKYEYFALRTQNRTHHRTWNMLLPHFTPSVYTVQTVTLYKICTSDKFS